MKLSYIIWTHLFVLLFTITTLGQIPRNIDSVKLIYDKVIAPVDTTGPKMRFSTEINGKELKATWKDYTYMEMNGVKSKLPLNYKNELWVLPDFKSDSVKLMFARKNQSISSGYFQKTYLLKGGLVYFGILNDFPKMANRYDNDEQYHTFVDNKHRGLADILRSTNVRKAAEDTPHPFRLYYVVMERGINENGFFYIK